MINTIKNQAPHTQVIHDHEINTNSLTIGDPKHTQRRVANTDTHTDYLKNQFKQRKKARLEASRALR